MVACRGVDITTIPTLTDTTEMVMDILLLLTITTLTTRDKCLQCHRTVETIIPGLLWEDNEE